MRLKGTEKITLAASVYWAPWNKVLNLRMNKSSAPLKLFRKATRRAKSGFDKLLTMYETMVSSSIVTESTCKMEHVFQ